VKHVKLVHKDCSISPFCPVCDGGLFVCRVCGIEGSFLTLECPGPGDYRVNSFLVRGGYLDFRGGKWIKIEGETV